MSEGEIYKDPVPAPPWPGGRLWTAVSGSGETVFLREAGKAEAGAAPYLSHQSLPFFLGHAASPALPGVRLLAYRHFEGGSVAGQLAGGGRFSQFEALKIAYDAVSALKYMHGLSPRVQHGAVSAGAVFRAGGGRALLCGGAEGGGAEGDLRGLAGLMRDMAAAPKGGPFSPGYKRIVDLLELPGGSAEAALKAMESLAAGPGEVPQPPAKKTPYPVRRVLRTALVAGAIGAALAGWLKFRLDYWPQLRAQRNIALETKLHRDYPCVKLPPPGPPALGVNLLKNPGLEGACGWHSWGGWERGMIRSGSAHGGGHFVEVPDYDYGVWQDVNVEAFGERIAAGACRVKLGGWLRAAGSGSDGAPYVFGYAMRSENDYSYLDGFTPASAANWTYAEKEWPLPPGTRKVRVILQKYRRLGSWLSKDAYFDDLTAELRCSGAPSP